MNTTNDFRASATQQMNWTPVKTTYIKSTSLNTTQESEQTTQESFTPKKRDLKLKDKISKRRQKTAAEISVLTNLCHEFIGEGSSSHT